MESTKLETTASILAEMRMGKTGDFPFAYMIGDPDTPEVVDFTTKKAVEPRKINIRRVTVRELADRLENAIKRELGNVAAMREALSDACYAMFDFLKTQIGGYEEMADALDKAKAALAETPRNCDVGSSEEQYRQYKEFCKAHHHPSYSGAHPKRQCDCPCYNEDGCCNFMIWAQMPYKPTTEGDKE